MITSLITFLNSFTPEFPALLLFFFSSLMILTMTRFFGKTGLYVYGALAIVIGNIQVLKGTHFLFWENPVALGTLIFSSTFVVTDTLTECFGSSAARRAVGLGFMASLFVTVSMLLTLGTKPLDIAITDPDFHFVTAHNAMMVLFTPSAAILTASLSAYLLSQLLDILIFQKLRQSSGKRGLWFRTSVATSIAFLIDNTVFSVLAWKVFSANPVSWHSLIWTYILGTYILRIITLIAYIPIVYATCKIIRKHLYAQP
ncbi:MAG: hypothetical protein K0R12_1002 [Gammaproteobacteria bacterium]|jgi:uncharacterized integral membrane protein (TIGR00697 family)|nr:hypothetical protein [Gammaproteobacteria bacterium]